MLVFVPLIWLRENVRGLKMCLQLLLRERTQQQCSVLSNQTPVSASQCLIHLEPLEDQGVIDLEGAFLLSSMPWEHWCVPDLPPAPAHWSASRLPWVPSNRAHVWGEAHWSLERENVRSLGTCSRLPLQEALVCNPSHTQHQHLVFHKHMVLIKHRVYCVARSLEETGTSTVF